MYFFCTYFDQNYLPRGLALYRSLRLHCPAFKLWVLCMDDESHRILLELDLPGVHAISLKAFERNDEMLRGAKENRSRIEYYFTCTPSLPLYVLDNWPDVNLITYLDADLFFFAGPDALFEEMGEGSIAITAHRFTPTLRDRERYGIYNVGWLSFRRDENALNCLRWWRERCIEWCFDREEDGRFADQKYLDDWPSRFDNVVVLQHKGANLAPWNLDNHRLRAIGDHTVTVDGQRLIFFHFHALKKAGRWIYDPGWIEYGVNPSSVLRSDIYLPYLRTLFGLNRELLRSYSGHPVSNSFRAWKKEQSVLLSPLGRVAARLRALTSLASEIAAGKMIFLPFSEGIREALDALQRKPATP